MVQSLALASLMALLSQPATADEGGVSFWVPGFFGSLAAVPQQPGWSLVNIYYHKIGDRPEPRTSLGHLIQDVQ
jgi:hypothetical protein